MKVSILGSDSTALCQISALREGFTALGHQHTPDYNDPDVAFVFVGNPDYSPYLELTKTKKVIFNVLDIPFHCEDLHEIIARFRAQLPCAARVTAISQTVANQVQEICGVKAETIYYPSKPVFYTGMKKYQGLRALLVGRVQDPNKNARIAVAALIRAGFEEHEVGVVGPEPLGYGRYFGVVTDEVLNDLYNSVDYVLMLSHIEGIGLSAPEGAMAGAIPIVLSSLTTFEEFWLHSPLGFQYQTLRSVDAVAKLLVDIEQNPEWKAQLKQDFRVYADKEFRPKFDKVEVAKRIVDVYLSIVSHPIGTCMQCGKEMAYNVPRLGANGGFVHKDSGSLSCYKN